MTPETQQRIEDLVKQSKIVVFMKGNKLMPQCGFSNNVVQILNSLGAPFETLDILADPEIRQGIKEYSNWPTIPPGLHQWRICRRLRHPDRAVPKW